MNSSDAKLTGEITDLLQRMIRNACVNDGTVQSGHENRNIELLEDYLADTGLSMQRYEPENGRVSLLVRMEGSDPTASTLMLMGHADVVPANPSGWKRDPFAAELVDGVVWGRGAIDMLNMTASMAVSLRHLVKTGFKPKGTLLYLAAADEEAGGIHGAKWLVENQIDDIKADYILTENGGVPVETPTGTKLLVTVGEKGVSWTRLTIKGTPSHGSLPFGTDNALIKAAEIVRRLAEYRATTHISETWRKYVEGMGFDEPLCSQLLDPKSVWTAIESLPFSDARYIHACTHMTVAPTVAHGGSKANTIPDQVQLDVDIRTLPGQTKADVEKLFTEVLSGFEDCTEYYFLHQDPSTISPTDTPLWDSLIRASAKLAPKATCVPAVITGATDSRFFRQLNIPSYGFGLFSKRTPFDLFMSMFHANDERVDQESLLLTTQMWDFVARDLLG